MLRIRSLFVLALLAGCDASGDTPADASELATASVSADASASAALDARAVGLTSHFRSWLSANGYGAYDFGRADLDGGSYGGRTSAGQGVSEHPVIFVHGNAGKALDWEPSLRTFHGKGYSTAELYATTWGPASVSQTAAQYHSRAHIERVRAFIVAVQAYTGAPRVDVVSHSMGVTLARKAIKGGGGHDALAGGAYTLGGPLTNSVDTFVGIAGANWGLVSCYQTGPTTPTCGSTNGLYPGVNGYGWGLSDVLGDLNATQGYEGRYVYSIWSTADQVIGYDNYVWGRRTSAVPGQDGQRTYSAAPYGHWGSRDRTGYVQWRMVRDHTTG